MHTYIYTSTAAVYIIGASEATSKWAGTLATHTHIYICIEQIFLARYTTAPHQVEALGILKRYVFITPLSCHRWPWRSWRPDDNVQHIYERCCQHSVRVLTRHEGYHWSPESPFVHVYRPARRQCRRPCTVCKYILLCHINYRVCLSTLSQKAGKVAHTRQPIPPPPIIPPFSRAKKPCTPGPWGLCPLIEDGQVRNLGFALPT